MSSYKRHPAGIARKSHAVSLPSNSKEMISKYKLLAMWLVLGALVATALRTLAM